MGDRVFITFDEAVELLLDGEYVHTFRNSAPGVMIGADWERKKLLELMKKSKIEIAGPAAAAMKHGIALFDDQGPLFIATKKMEDSK